MSISTSFAHTVRIVLTCNGMEVLVEKSVQAFNSSDALLEVMSDLEETLPDAHFRSASTRPPVNLGTVGV